MVEMLDYHLQYALMATEDRVRDRLAGRRNGRPIRPHRRRMRGQNTKGDAK